MHVILSHGSLKAALLALRYCHLVHNLLHYKIKKKHRSNVEFIIDDEIISYL